MQWGAPLLGEQLLRFTSLLSLVWIMSGCLVFLSPSRHIIAPGLLRAPLWVSVTVPTPFTRPMKAVSSLCVTGTAWGSFSRHWPSCLCRNLLVMSNRGSNPMFRDLLFAKRVRLVDLPILSHTWLQVSRLLRIVGVRLCAILVCNRSHYCRFNR